MLANTTPELMIPHLSLLSCIKTQPAFLPLSGRTTTIALLDPTLPTL